MVALCYEAPSQELGAEMLVGKDHGQKFPLYVGIPGLHVREALAGKGNWLVIIYVIISKCCSMFSQLRS